MEGLIVSIVLFVLYPLFVSTGYGVQFSISETARTLENNLGWYGSSIFFWWGVAFLSLLLSVEVNGLWVAAILVELFLFAASSFWRDKLTKVVHMVSSIGGILLGIASVAVYLSSWEYVVVSAMIIGGMALVTKNKIWWVEIASFMCIVVPVIVFS